MATVVKNDLTGSTANVNNYAGTAFTPVAGDLLFVISHATGSIEPAVSHTCTASANGITFTQISRLEHTLSGNVSFLYVANQLVPSSPASMTVSSNHSTDAATGCFVACGSVTGMTRTGAAAVRQSALSPNLAANAAWDATFAAATLTSNPLVGFEGDAGGVSGATTPPTSWTEIDEPAEQATPASHFEWAKSDSGLTSTTYTWTYSVATVRANVGAWEFDSSAAASAPSPLLRLVNPRRAPVRLGRYKPLQGTVASGPQTASLSASVGFTGAQTRRTAHVTAAAVSFGGTGSTSYNTTINAIPSLIARWKLDDTSGAVAVASVGSDGGYTFSPTLGDPGLVSDGGTAVTYDGNGTQESTHPFGALSTAGWVAFWFKSTDASAVGIPLRDTTSTNGTFPINFGGTNVAARVGGTDHTISPAVASSTLKDGNRHFIVFQTDGSNVSLYIDGTLAETWTRAAHTWNNILVSPWHLAHNGSSAGAANYLAMTGDDLAMGDNATLTAGDVTNLWNAGTGAGGTAGLTKRTSTSRTATVSFAGAIASRAGKALAATLAFVGALTTPVGNLFTQALTATVSFTGAQAKRTATVKTATVSFAGAQTRAVAKLVTATVSFTAAQARRVAAGLVAALSFAGALTRRVGHPFTATVSFSGSVATAAVHVFTQALTAALSFTGAQVRRTAAVKTATVSFTGAQTRRTAAVKTAALSFTGTQVNRVGHLLTATVSFTGAQTRRAGHLFTASVSFTGSHATLAVHFFTQALTATVGFTGTFSKRTTHAIAATVGFTVGALTRRISHTQAAAVGFVGTLGRGIGHRLSAALGFVGTLLGVKSGAATAESATLHAAVHPHTLTASTINRTQTAATQANTLTAATHATTLTAASLGRTLEET